MSEADSIHSALGYRTPEEVAAEHRTLVTRKPYVFSGVRNADWKARPSPEGAEECRESAGHAIPARLWRGQAGLPHGETLPLHGCDF